MKWSLFIVIFAILHFVGSSVLLIGARGNDVSIYYNSAVDPLDATYTIEGNLPSSYAN